jgi:tungstate transport system ATP-binding protein
MAEDTRQRPLLPLRLEGVSYAVNGRVLLDAVNAVLTSGPRTVILGPNGAGKSLLMRICHGLIQPSAGRVHWSASETSGRPRRQAMLFQRPVMLRRSVQANVAYALALAGVPRGERAEQSHSALERVGLAGLARRPARVLSVGEQQRLAFARAWALEPEVLFLDEPTASLDPGATRDIETLIGAIHQAGAKIVMTTHNLGQARRIADEIIFMHQGRLLEQTAVERFFRQPATDEARIFIRDELPWA